MDGKPAWYRPPQPYQRGNLESVKHGAYSARMVERRASEFLADLQAEGCAWLTEVDAVQLDVFLKARSRYDLMCEGLDAYIEEHGVVEAAERKLMEHLLGQERNVMKLAQDLGLDPTGRARLLKDLGLAKQFAKQGARELAGRGAEIRRARSGG